MTPSCPRCGGLRDISRKADVVLNTGRPDRSGVVVPLEVLPASGSIWTCGPCGYSFLAIAGARGEVIPYGGEEERVVR